MRRCHPARLYLSKEGGKARARHGKTEQARRLSSSSSSSSSSSFSFSSSSSSSFRRHVHICIQTEGETSSTSSGPDIMPDDIPVSVRHTS